MFLVIARAFVAAVDVYNVQGFSSFDDQIHAAVEVHGFPEGGFYLPGDSEVVENWRSVIVIVYDIGFFGRNLLDIRFGICVDIFIVDNDPVKAFVEQIAEDTGSFSLLAQNFLRGLGTVEVGLDIFPGLNQGGKIFV